MSTRMRRTLRRRSGIAAGRLGMRAVALCLLLAAGGCRKQLAPADRPSGPGSVAATSAPEPIVVPSTPPALAGVVSPPARGAFLGAYLPPAPFDIRALDAYARISPKAPSILMWYQPWAEKGPHEFDPAACVSVYQRGATPMITWEPWNPGTDANFLKEPANQPAFKLAAIIDGRYDDYIRGFARGVKSARGPVMIRLMHEMNGNWYPWGGTTNGNSPAQFVAAWRHVHGLFAEEGATNVTWVWSINHESVPSTNANRFAAYYPGDAYVDWVAASGFNWGSASPYSTWRTFDQRYRKPLAYLKTLRKPVMLAELGTVEQGGSKATWITDAYAQIRTRHPEIKAVVYYNSLEKGPKLVQDWRITTSSASTRAYRSAVEPPYFVAGPTPELGAWKTALTTDNWTYLRSLPPVY